MVAHLRIKPFHQDIIDTDDIISLRSTTLSVSGSSIACPAPYNSSSQASASYALLKPLGSNKYEVLYWVDEKTNSYSYPPRIYINFSTTY